MAYIAPFINAIGGWGAAASYAAAGVTAYSAIQSGKANQAAANMNAEAAQREAESRSSLIRQESARRSGMIRAQIGKSGATTAGTPLLVLAESAANAEIDALNAQYTGQTQASLYRSSGANARRQGNLLAGTGILSAGANLLSEHGK